MQNLIPHILNNVRSWLGRQLTLDLKGMKLVSVEHTLEDLTDTAAIADVFPAGVIPLGITVRVTEAVTTDDSPATDSFDVGITGGDADAFGNDIDGAEGTTTTSADFTADPTSLWASSAQGVTIAATGGSFLTGAVKLVVSYLQAEAPAA